MCSWATSSTPASTSGGRSQRDEEFFRITSGSTTDCTDSAVTTANSAAEAAHYRGSPSRTQKGFRNRSMPATWCCCTIRSPWARRGRERDRCNRCLAVPHRTALSNRWTEDAWTFLRPHLGACRAFVFSRESYAPSWLPANGHDDPSSIDPFSPKNQGLADPEVRSILTTVGVLAGRRRAALLEREATPPASHAPCRHRRRRSAARPGDAVVIQVSRWDRLKDMQGSWRASPSTGSSGTRPTSSRRPGVAGVTDDPEGAEVLEECVARGSHCP